MGTSIILARFSLVLLSQPPLRKGGETRGNWKIYHRRLSLLLMTLAWLVKGHWNTKRAFGGWLVSFHYFGEVLLFSFFCFVSSCGFSYWEFIKQPLDAILNEERLIPSSTQRVTRRRGPENLWDLIESLTFLLICYYSYVFWINCLRVILLIEYQRSDI